MAIKMLEKLEYLYGKRLLYVKPCFTTNALKIFEIFKGILSRLNKKISLRLFLRYIAKYH